jgi:hypothetical protein
MAVGKPIIGVLERGTEVRRLIEMCGSGLCCDPNEYEVVDSILNEFISKYSTAELAEMGEKGRKYLERDLAKNISIEKYKKNILSCGR